MFSERELEKQTSTAKKYILFGFLPTIILAVLISIYRINSLEYNKKEYLRIKNLEIKGKVIKKYRTAKDTRPRRTIVLDTNIQEQLTKEEFSRVSIGDSVIKQKGSDTISFHLRNGKIIYIDYNKFQREKYLELLKKKK